MLMPGRRGSVNNTGTFTTNDGHTIQLPQNLNINTRTGNQPTEYKATQEVNFTEGFASGTRDDQFSAFISDGSVAEANGEVNELSGASVYRYGFNGQEKSDEINGEGNSYTAEFWEYDPRVGRRWNVDPKPTIDISVYSTFANNPILKFDPKGDTTINGEKYEGDNKQSATYLKEVFVHSTTLPKKALDRVKFEIFFQNF